MPHYYVAHHGQPITATLLARLQAAFGPGTVAHTAMPLDTGADVRKAAAKYAASADAVLVVIGPDWVSRVRHADDLARIATTYALKYQRRVVPVMIDGAMLPDAALLPQALHRVVYLSPYGLRDVENDIVRLIALLQRSQQNPSLPQQPTYQPAPSTQQTTLQKPRTVLGWLLWPFRLVAWLLMSIVRAVVWLVKTIIQQALKSVIALIVTVLVFGLVGAIVAWFVVSLVQSNMDAIQALASMADSFREMLSGLSNFQNMVPPLS